MAEHGRIQNDEIKKKNGSKNGFISYVRLDIPIIIRLGDHTSNKVTNHGNVLVQNQCLNALHTPTFRYSLLSVGEFDRLGYITRFADGTAGYSRSTMLLVADSATDWATDSTSKHYSEPRAPSLSTTSVIR